MALVCLVIGLGIAQALGAEPVDFDTDGARFLALWAMGYDLFTALKR